MTKVIVCLIQFLVLITMQIVSQITVCDEQKDKEILKVYTEKENHVEKCEAKKELKTIKKNQTIIA
ncbi:hypothetical protein [Flavobacterium laiguense]|jgi:hypothetical protein|uniref:Uncharacterized protein n=1 Tax=Flavobacterium laiguense TaxID=2169409 RepID=A0A2U1JTC9_9FLAO|nr:hypothetical protein [Flavobacterium laiguense]PWA08372.1 hypothetical protein DB891_12275 [Flavobacterium laiguense]